MIAVLRALKSERLKLRRTLALWLVLIAPLVVCWLYFMVSYERGPEAYHPDQFNSWLYLQRNILAVWMLLALPLFLTLVTALIANTEHSEKTWKHLFALPIPRHSIYLAKFLMAAALMLASNLVLVAGTVIFGLLLRLLQPGLGFEAPIPLWDLVKPLLFIQVSGCLMLAIHTFVSLRWKSFTVASAFGVIATVINLMASRSETSAKIYPWALISHYLQPELNYLAPSVAIGLGVGLLVVLLGAWHVTRQDVL